MWVKSVPGRGNSQCQDKVCSGLFQACSRKGNTVSIVVVEREGEMVELEVKEVIRSQVM